MILFLVFVLGAALGSFLNVVIYRLPRGESLVRPRSHCPHCGAPIAARDNVPIVSYLILRGRCRNCGRPIAARYPLVELTSGILLVAVWLASITWLQFLSGGLLVLMLVAITFIDLEHQIVPDLITYPGIAAGLLLAAAAGRVVDAALTAAVAGTFFLLIILLSRGGMGGGDVKLAALLGAFLGWPNTGVAVFAAFVLGAAVGVFLLVTGRRSRKDPIPFGPALAAGGVIALFAGGPILRWYLGP